MIETKHSNRSVTLTIPVEYFDTSFNMGVTTNVVASVKNKGKMLEYMAGKLSDVSYDSEIGKAIDNLCREAIENGECFLEV